MQAYIQEAAFDDWCYYVDLDIKYAKSRWIEGIDENGPRKRDLEILQMIADRSKIDRLRVLAQYFLKHHQAPCTVVADVPVAVVPVAVVSDKHVQECIIVIKERSQLYHLPHCDRIGYLQTIDIDEVRKTFSNHYLRNIDRVDAERAVANLIASLRA